MIKFRDIKNQHHGYDIRLDDSMLSEEDKDITLLEFNEKYKGIKTVWIYCDTLEQLSNKRPCNHCKLDFEQTDGYAVDPCYGKLEGVLGACCGHGNPNKQYINMADDSGWKMTLEEYKELMRLKNEANK
jgi:hypothetical protein